MTKFSAAFDRRTLLASAAAAAAGVGLVPRAAAAPRDYGAGTPVRLARA